MPSRGRTLVLLHGMGTGPEAWQPQIKAFGPSHRVLAPALELAPKFRIAEEAHRLWALTDPDPVDLCGLPLGALIALRMALDEPHRVRRLVLCAGFAALPRSLRALQAVLGMTAGKRYRAVFREGRRFDVTRELDRLTLPGLVLVGERDWPNRRLSRALADRLPNARFRLVEGAGHVANVDAPVTFNEALRAFLDVGPPDPGAGRPDVTG